MTGDGPANTAPSRTRPREIDDALRDLNECIARIHDLIPRVNAVIERRTQSVRPQTRARVVYGGGPSAFAPQRQAPSASPRPGEVRPLIVAADLALAGYSEEQIRARLREFDQSGGAEALGEAFE
jgi:hypothetical protein